MQLAIFDCDGVLVNSEEIYQAVEYECLTREGFVVDQNTYMQTMMGLSPSAWMVKLRDVATAQGITLGAEFFARLDRDSRLLVDAQLAALPGASEMIARLTVQKCVASSTPSRRLREKLVQTGLVDLFDPHIFSSDMVANGKPAPDLFLHAAATRGVSPEHCLVVEDSGNGVLAGKAAGMRVVGFTLGKHCGPGHGEALIRSGADEIASSYAELAAIINRSVGPP